MNINEINEAFDREYKSYINRPEYTEYKEDFVYRIIRACGLSTTNSDINAFALEKIIEDIKATEREVCARLMEEVGKQTAAAIRARGDKHD